MGIEDSEELRALQYAEVVARDLVAFSRDLFFVSLAEVLHERDILASPRICLDRLVKGGKVESVKEGHYRYVFQNN
jgi:hypothetical protein